MSTILLLSSSAFGSLAALATLALEAGWLAALMVWLGSNATAVAVAAGSGRHHD